MKKNRSFGMSIGTSSILVIVVILTLVCFAGLSLASANADYQSCKKLADRTTAYYKATSEGFRAIEAACADLEGAESKKQTELAEGAESVEDNVADVEEVVQENSKELKEFRNSYNISDNQVLKVNAILNPGDGTNYQLTSFNVLTVDTPKLDESLSLLLQE